MNLYLTDNEYYAIRKEVLVWQNPMDLEKDVMMQITLPM